MREVSVKNFTLKLPLLKGFKRIIMIIDYLIFSAYPL